MINEIRKPINSIDLQIINLNQSGDGYYVKSLINTFFEAHPLCKKLNSLRDFYKDSETVEDFQDFIYGTLQEYEIFNNIIIDIHDFEQDFERSLNLDYDLGLQISYYAK